MGKESEREAARVRRRLQRLKHTHKKIYKDDGKASCSELQLLDMRRRKRGQVHIHGVDTARRVCIFRCCVIAASSVRGTDACHITTTATTGRKECVGWSAMNGNEYVIGR